MHLSGRGRGWQTLVEAVLEASLECQSDSSELNLNLISSLAPASNKSRTRSSQQVNKVQFGARIPRVELENCNWKISHFQSVGEHALVWSLKVPLRTSQLKFNFWVFYGRLMVIRETVSWLCQLSFSSHLKSESKEFFLIKSLQPCLLVKKESQISNKVGKDSWQPMVSFQYSVTQSFRLDWRPPVFIFHSRHQITEIPPESVQNP